VLKTFALVVALALGPHAAFMCLADCATTAPRSAGCHQPSGEDAVESVLHCVTSPGTVSRMTDAAGRMQLPGPAVTLRHAALVDVAGTSPQTTLIARRFAAPGGIRPLHLRI
jgi:hypothetical protein